jgi:hypothetical protein
VGGKFSSASIVADNLNINLVTGNGGAATTTGKGGVGGGISSVALVTGGQVSAANVVVSATSGTGGAGMLTGKGGAGGNVLSTNLTTGRVTEQGVLPGGAVTLTGGAGGNGGATGASGAGAAISTVNGTSTDASVSILAGNAGLTGAKAGKGGGITGVRASAQTDTTVHAGNGSNGGAGGNLQTIGFTGPLFGAPTGNIALIAGNGSGAGMKAGAGGNVSNASGFVSTGSGTTTQIRAGNGGSVATKAAAGGSVLNINILNDLDPAGAGSGSVFTIDAGDATAAASAAKGGVGGSVKGVFVSHLDAATVFQHIAAGNGGDTSLANGIGGVGGSVQNVNVDHDIGNISDGVTPSGQAFGYTTMGGIFAGSGGINTTVAHTATTLDSHDGKAGNVTNIAAQAIASIVAGRPVTGTVITARNLVTTVDEITLIAKDVDAGVQLARVDSNGKYTNYVIANLVGAVVNPNQAGVAYPTAHPHANTFDTGEYNDLNADVTFSLGDSANASTDGFIGALNLTANKNFVPEAFLTLDPSGNSLFIDYTNGKATP